MAPQRTVFVADTRGLLAIVACTVCAARLFNCSGGTDVHLITCACAADDGDLHRVVARSPVW